MDSNFSFSVLYYKSFIIFSSESKNKPKISIKWLND